MKSAAISRFVVVTAIAALVVVGGSTAAWAAPCPASPNYATDFSSRPECVQTNVNAAVATVLQLTANSGNQYGSAWYTVPQVVQNGFTTSFKFQFTTTTTPADGIAFVIQNAGLTAIGSPPNGGAIGYGASDDNPDPSQGAGIPHSLAIEFDTFRNGWDPAASPDDLSGNVSHVAVQSCGNGPNTSHHSQACGGGGPTNSTLGAAVLVPALASTGSPTGTHTVTITYAPLTGSTPANIHVMLDGHDLYSGGIPVDLSSIGLGDGGTAFVGFTGATGNDHETQVVQNWTFSPQTQIVTQGQPAVFSSQGGFDANPDGGFDYNAQLNAGTPVAVQVKQILIDQSVCTGIVQRTPNFHGAQCFAYRKADGTNPKSVMFEITCPLSPGGTCGTNANQNFSALLGTDFHFNEADNAGFHNPLDPPNNPAAAFPGWLKGDSGVAGQPCFTTPSSGQLFSSNQVNFFQVLPGDPPAKTKGGSGGTGSCWVATYNQPDEALPGITITSPTNTSYAQGAIIPAAYNCKNPTTSKLPELNLDGSAASLVGPYLTAATCTQATGNPNPCTQTTSGLSCTGTVDTTAAGPHTFKVTATDSGTNPNSAQVNYTVVAPADLRITKSALSKIPVNSNLTYLITLVNRNPNPNPASAVGVVVTDPLPPNTTFVSAAGVNNLCTTTGGRLNCSIISVPCPRVGNTVTCQVGTVGPAATWFLNGVAIQITVGVKNVGVGNLVKNTATVTEINTDPNGGDNSASATTTVTAH
jgi:uncharacterized repeat protein (TIGR01451 family)